MPKKDQPKIRLFRKIFLVSQFAVAAIVWLKPYRLVAFLRNQRRELNELKRGDEDVMRFVKDSGVLLKNLFIPTSDNGNSPKILRAKSLAGFVAVAIVVKVLVTSFLFISYPTPAELSAIVSGTMIKLINESREESGAELLVLNPALNKFAAIKGNDMIERDYFAHDTPEGKRPWQWIDRAEYDYVYAGENLAMDFTSAETVHEALMKSPSHRKNILNPKYNDIGIAVLNGTLSGRGTILLVEFFGSQRIAQAPVAATQDEPPVVGATVPAPTPNPTPVKQPEPDPIVAGANRDIALNTSPDAENAQAIDATSGVISVSTPTNHNIVRLVVEYSNIFFIAFMIFLTISLAINIFVKIHIQHPSVILQSVAVIALFGAMLLVKLHFVETITPQLLIH